MATAPPQPPPLPPPLSTAGRARRRARQVSSRYLSTPLPPSPRPSSSTSSPAPSPRARLHPPSTPFADENHRPTPSAAQPHPPTTTRKRAVMKLFDESTNAAERPRGPRPAAPPTTAKLARSASAGAGAAATARKGYPRPPTPARFSSFPPSENSSETSSTVTDSSDDAETCSIGSGAAAAATFCESPPLLGPASCRVRPSSELRSSVPEATPSMGSARASNPLCYRSLNSALLSCQPIRTSAKAVVPPRPPQPPGLKAAAAAAEVKKAGKKASGRQEDVHKLRLLENCYVQYRLLNAKAEVAEKAKTTVAEKSLYGLSEKIASLRESVVEKKAELEQIKRVERLHEIVDAQVPYLDRWSDLEGDHSTCLSGATTALQDASLRLPITGNIRADIGEITEVLNSAMHLMGPLSPCVESFLPKAGEIDDVASNLAEIVISERALIEECGNLLYQAQNMQMREYSLRSQLMQLKQNNKTT